MADATEEDDAAEQISDRPILLTEARLRKIIVDSVHEALTRLGIDAADPLEMQRDMLHLREWRQATSMLQKRGLTVVFTLLMTGLLTAVWLGLKHMLTLHNTGT